MSKEKVVFESSDEILIRQIIGLLEDNDIAYTMMKEAGVEIVIIKK